LFSFQFYQRTFNRLVAVSYIRSHKQVTIVTNSHIRRYRLWQKFIKLSFPIRVNENHV